MDAIWDTAMVCATIFCSPSLFFPLSLSPHKNHLLPPSSFDSLDVISSTGQWPHIMLLIGLPSTITRGLITAFSCVETSRPSDQHQLTGFTLHHWESSGGTCRTNYSHWLTLRVLLGQDFVLEVISHSAWRWLELFTVIWTSLLHARGA